MIARAPAQTNSLRTLALIAALLALHILAAAGCGGAGEIKETINQAVNDASAQGTAGAASTPYGISAVAPGRIVYSLATTSSYNVGVYSMALDGSDNVQVIDNYFLDFISTSEDSDIVVYAGFDDFMPYASHHTYAIRSDGSGLVDLTPNAESTLVADYQGDKVYYAQRPCSELDGCTSHLHSVNIDGSGDQRLATIADQTILGYFQVASDASFAVYVDSLYAPTSLTRLDLQSGATSTVYKSTGNSDNLSYAFDLSPDDKSVVIGRDCGMSSVYCAETVKFDVQSGAMETIAANLTIGIALWSPNGKYIAYSEMGEDYSSRVYIYDVAARTSTRIKENSSARYLLSDWSDNGKYILAGKFYSNTRGDLVMFSCDGSEEVQFTNNADGFGAGNGHFSK